MSNDYTQAPATIMLATNCVCCGRPLVDACSVELGIGPECRNGIFPEGVVDAERKAANKLVFEAAVAAQGGHAQKVVELSDEIRKLGFGELADKVERRFKRGVTTGACKADIVINEDGADLLVKTPYRRGEAQAFIDAWRNIPGRRYDRPTKLNRIPKAQRAALWDLLKRFFPGKWGRGPKGVFRIPTASKVVEAQPELKFDEDALEDQPELDAEAQYHNEMAKRGWE